MEVKQLSANASAGDGTQAPPAPLPAATLQTLAPASALLGEGRWHASQRLDPFDLTLEQRLFTFWDDFSWLLRPRRTLLENAQPRPDGSLSSGWALTADLSTGELSLQHQGPPEGDDGGHAIPFTLPANDVVELKLQVRQQAAEAVADQQEAEDVPELTRMCNLRLELTSSLVGVRGWSYSGFLLPGMPVFADLITKRFSADLGPIRVASAPEELLGATTVLMLHRTRPKPQQACLTVTEDCHVYLAIHELQAPADHILQDYRRTGRSVFLSSPRQLLRFELWRLTAPMAAGTQLRFGGVSDSSTPIWNHFVVLQRAASAGATGTDGEPLPLDPELPMKPDLPGGPGQPQLLRFGGAPGPTLVLKDLLLTPAWEPASLQRVKAMLQHPLCSLLFKDNQGRKTSLLIAGLDQLGLSKGFLQRPWAPGFLDWQDEAGDSALLISARRGLSMVPLLLRAGADPGLRNLAGEDAFVVANSASIRRMLLDYGYPLLRLAEDPAWTEHPEWPEWSARQASTSVELAREAREKRLKEAAKMGACMVEEDELRAAQPGADLVLQQRHQLAEWQAELERSRLQEEEAPELKAGEEDERPASGAHNIYRFWGQDPQALHFELLAHSRSLQDPHVQLELEAGAVIQPGQGLHFPLNLELPGEPPSPQGSARLHLGQEKPDGPTNQAITRLMASGDSWSVSCLLSVTWATGKDWLRWGSRPSRGFGCALNSQCFHPFDAKVVPCRPVTVVGQPATADDDQQELLIYLGLAEPIKVCHPRPAEGAPELGSLVLGAAQLAGTLSHLSLYPRTLSEHEILSLHQELSGVALGAFLRHRRTLVWEQARLSLSDSGLLFRGHSLIRGLQMGSAPRLTSHAQPLPELPSHRLCFAPEQPENPPEDPVAPWLPNSESMPVLGWTLSLELEISRAWDPEADEPADQLLVSRGPQRGGWSLVWVSAGRSFELRWWHQAVAGGGMEWARVPLARLPRDEAWTRGRLQLRVALDERRELRVLLVDAEGRLRARTHQSAVQLCLPPGHTPVLLGSQGGESFTHGRLHLVQASWGRQLTQPPGYGAAEGSGAAALACDHLLPGCGHPCHGVFGERRHPPCLQPECVRKDDGHVDCDSLCPVCQADRLGRAPVLQLRCGHLFHFECLERRLAARWTGGSRISFGYLGCPVCRGPLQHPALDTELRPHLRLELEVGARALARLEQDGLLEAPELHEVGSEWLGRPAAWAMARYSFLECESCGELSFRGTVQCAEDAIDADETNLVAQLCVDCAALPAEAGDPLVRCLKHGEDAVSWKCRYCCSLATRHSFGSVHLCDACHARSDTLVRARDGSNRLPLAAIPQCSGLRRRMQRVLEDPELDPEQQLAALQRLRADPLSCPLRMAHPPNGMELALGCGQGCGREQLASAEPPAPEPQVLLPPHRDL